MPRPRLSCPESRLVPPLPSKGSLFRPVWLASLLVSPEGQQVVELRDFNSLGRHPNNTIQLLDKIVSKEHCIIERRGDHYVLRDLGSLNGTYINGERVHGERELKHGDDIALGGTRAPLRRRLGPTRCRRCRPPGQQFSAAGAAGPAGLAAARARRSTSQHGGYRRRLRRRRRGRPAGAPAFTRAPGIRGARRGSPGAACRRATGDARRRQRSAPRDRHADRRDAEGLSALRPDRRATRRSSRGLRAAAARRTSSRARSRSSAT